MPKFVAFVFKVLISVLLIGIIVSAATMIIMSFITINRIQNIAQIVQMDIAEHNCMLYPVYDSYASQVLSICDRSTLRGLNLIDVEDRADPSSFISVYKKGHKGENSYIQDTEGSEGTIEGGTGEFTVANYGDILCFETKVFVRPQLFYAPAGPNSPTTQDFEVIVMTGPDGNGYPVTLTYEVPALTYLK